ncbi:uncharacterized protein MELLADRAFT_66717 [Melampsora larici-populina 98AG31]|uniref:F-box domain-containing protein n=1 Tax=Melampsora larici-populina (strain 98AG31 / pathotype 3-4-7) TaxID=747676 RepID=F4S0B0_MELLP|nr:uncharacterized protein MELLADRAFT_66717 [Melampsora larici-populina 98AG31]EGG01930.1 hypothetical protein MELLADRAFT_66717 [Melampsora larici-populina 98AG31]
MGLAQQINILIPFAVVSENLTRTLFSYSLVNEIFESRARLGSEISSHETEEVIQIEELRHKPRALGLMDLPLEILNDILEMLNHMARLEGEVIKEDRWETATTWTSGEKQTYMTYLREDPPILNTIQTFSLTSRKIYQLCRPWLWQKLQFPTRLPAPIGLWTNDILLKQGSLVRSLTLELSENCSKPEGSVEYDPYYDNLILNMEDEDPERVSPKNAKDLITRCPNLSELEIRYEVFGESEDAVEVTGFLSDLIPLIISLKHLRQLSLITYLGNGPMVIFPSELLLGLPLLESLSCIDEQWCLYNWPKIITLLTIHSCGDLSPSLACRIIRHIAPCLQDLRLGFEQGDGSWEIDPSWIPGHRLDLPSLTYLKLCTRNPHLLDSFQDCKSLTLLGWTYITLEHCRILSGIVFRPAWPQLKKLVVTRGHDVDQNALNPRNRAIIEDELVSLEHHCKQANIIPIIHRCRPDMP